MEKIKQYCYLMRLDKPIGLLLLLWPTLWGLWLAAKGVPNLKILTIFILGVFLMRAAGCVINDLADRNFDKFVARTKHRPITIGHISSREAVFLFIFLCGMAFGLVLLLNLSTILLSIVGLLLAIVYPFLKRVTHLPQLGLGLAFSWGIPMAFMATNEAIPAAAWELFLASSLWSIIYDTMYAMVDKPDDINIGIKSTAILFGQRAWIIIASLQLIFLLLLVDVGRQFNLKQSYFVMLVFAGFFFLDQQKLLKKGNSSNYFKAFLNNQWVGMIIFFGVVLSYL